jgi:5'-nucleotidase
MKFLISNDDSVHARGIKVLTKELRKLGKAVVVAPMEEKSTTGHSLTLHKPLRCLKIEKDFYAVTGSPADCICVGLKEVLKSEPDFVVSGINRGANLGQDVYYSGTVSAAREACFWGIPAIAVSLAIEFNSKLKEDQIHYLTAAKVVSRLIQSFKGLKFPKHTLLNVNVPDLPYQKLKGIQWTRQGFRFYSGDLIKRRDHRGRDYFWVGGQYKGFHNVEGTDCYAVEKGFVSITPLALDSTHYEFIEQVRDQFKLRVP